MSWSTLKIMQILQIPNPNYHYILPHFDRDLFYIYKKKNKCVIKHTCLTF